MQRTRKPSEMMRDTLPPHLTYMIAEQLLRNLDVTKFRGYGLGDRDPSTLPGRKSGSESEWDNERGTRNWKALRKWVASANSAGVKY